MHEPPLLAYLRSLVDMTDDPSHHSDEYYSYTGENHLPQKSGYMLASTAALRLVPGAKPQPLHRVSLDSSYYLFTELYTDFPSLIDRTKSLIWLDLIHQTHYLHQWLDV